MTSAASTPARSPPQRRQLSSLNRVKPSDPCGPAPLFSGGSVSLPETILWWKTGPPLYKRMLSSSTEERLWGSCVCVCGGGGGGCPITNDYPHTHIHFLHGVHFIVISCLLLKASFHGRPLSSGADADPPGSPLNTAPLQPGPLPAPAWLMLDQHIAYEVLKK